MKLAPIVLFVYNRPEHLRQTIEALKQNDLASESELFIYSDGPKNEADASKIYEVREYIKKIEGFKDLVIIEKENNAGLAKSVIAGVDAVLERFEKIIVLEDDLAVSPFFLDYMNAALNIYENIDQVMQISGFMFPVKFRNVSKDCFFLPFTTTWGWGTWKRAWRHFDNTMKGYERLRENKELRRSFDMRGTYPYFDMLERQMRGEVNSWGIQWYLAVFINNGIVLHPRISLSKNIGFDKHATHTRMNEGYSRGPVLNTRIHHYPENAEIDAAAMDDCLRFFAEPKSVMGKIMQRLLPMRHKQ